MLDRLNIARVCCDDWAEREPSRTAIIEVGPDFALSIMTYGEMRREAEKLAASFARAGLGVGDRIAIFLPQGRFVPIAHMAIYKLGAIAVPLAVLFGPEAITYRAADAGARLIVTDRAGAARLNALRSDLPAVETILSMDGEAEGAVPLARFTEGAADGFPPATPRRMTPP